MTVFPSSRACFQQTLISRQLSQTAWKEMITLMVDLLLVSWVSRENLALGYQDSKGSQACQAFLVHLERRATSGDPASLESKD